MYIEALRVVGIRCFDDTGQVKLGPGCNLFIGANNAGKSTLLKAILHYQTGAFNGAELRPNVRGSGTEISIASIGPEDRTRFTFGLPDSGDRIRLQKMLTGDVTWSGAAPSRDMSQSIAFHPNWPHNAMVPLLARRKASTMHHTVNDAASNARDGTFSNLYCRVDRLASAAHPSHKAYRESVLGVCGLDITSAPSPHGKHAGIYLDPRNFITLEQMGDGVTEVVGLIVDLCEERGKVFVVEEPETHLHPSGLKALLDLIKIAAQTNQFIIATHSNIVMRELGSAPGTRVFRVYRDGDTPLSPSRIERIGEEPSQRIGVLRELGYEFADLGLHDGWLFLEEASAEAIFNQVLIPRFAPSLHGRLRTYSSAGADQLAPKIASFVSLVTFIHLEPVYHGRVWVRADGDTRGKEAVADVRKAISWMSEEACTTFNETSFERYYPAQFAEAANAALSEKDKKKRNAAKHQLLQTVLKWTKECGDDATKAWTSSASEPIELLHFIQDRLLSTSGTE